MWRKILIPHLTSLGQKWSLSHLECQMHFYLFIFFNYCHSWRRKNSGLGLMCSLRVHWSQRSNKQVNQILTVITLTSDRQYSEDCSQGRKEQVGVFINLLSSEICCLTLSHWLSHRWSVQLKVTWNCRATIPRSPMRMKWQLMCTNTQQLL